MNIILDTHIFLWLAQGSYKDIKQMNHLKDLNNNLYLSSISIAEIYIKVSIGKLRFDGDLLEVLKDMGVEILNFDGKSALLLENLPLYHRDPFDRMIIAQSIANDFKIISAHKEFKNYSCKLL